MFIQRYFNTSHVTVYHQQWIFPVSRLAISIHLMLRFINNKLGMDSTKNYFNTSHVTVYLVALTYYLPPFNYFNTSHVTVYQRREKPCSGSVLISIHLMLRFIKISAGSRCTITIFQYISCYGLSCLRWFKTIRKEKFQYISCYGLSLKKVRQHQTQVYFNTSHVTVYRPCRYGVSGTPTISIHLMLRFICRHIP